MIYCLPFRGLSAIFDVSCRPEVAQGNVIVNMLFCWNPFVFSDLQGAVVLYNSYNCFIYFRMDLNIGVDLPFFFSFVALAVLPLPLDYLSAL